MQVNRKAKSPVCHSIRSSNIYIQTHIHRFTVSNCAFNAFRNDAAAVKHEVAHGAPKARDVMKQNLLHH
jgi:hypothetical protein